MTLDIRSVLEGGPSYGVIDAKDGYLLYGRQGHEAEFRALAAELQDGAEGFEVIPIRDIESPIDRLFIAPLDEDRSFAPED